MTRLFCFIDTTVCMLGLVNIVVIVVSSLDLGQGLFLYLFVCVACVTDQFIAH